MARILALLVLLIAAVYAHDKHKSKKHEDVNPPEVHESGGKERTEGEKALPQEGTEVEGHGQHEDYHKFMEHFAGDYSKYMGSGSDASPQSGDWKSLMEPYAGQGGNSHGNFEKYMDKYTGDQTANNMGASYKQIMEEYAGGKQYNQYINQYAGKYWSGDVSEYMRANQGTKIESGYEPDLHQDLQQATAASPSFFVAEEDESANSEQAKAAAEAAQLQTAEGDASSRAQRHVEELKKMAAQMKANMKNDAADMASSIESDTRREFHDQRKHLQQHWVAKLKALNATELASAKWDSVEKAFDAVADADNQLRNLDGEMLKAMRHAYHERREAKHGHVRALAHEARKASQEANHLGSKVEDRQHSAGVAERAYEREWARSERASEGLGLEAEEAGDAAEEAVEGMLEHVEERVENRLDALKEAAAQEHRVRKEEEAKAEKAVVEARKASHQHAESQATTRSQASTGSPTLLVELAAVDDKDKDQDAKSDDQDKAAAEKDEGKAEPSTEEKPSKQEIARKKLEEATEQTEGIVSELRQLATREHENVEKNAKDAVKAIIAKAHENLNEHRQMAESEWHKNLKALSAESLVQAKDEEVHRAVEAARHAQDRLREVDQKQVDAEREAYDHMQRKQDNEVRKLGEQARKGARKMDELARHLKDRDTQDKAGRQSERLEREAEDATDKVEDDLDKKFRLVQDLLDRHMHEEEKAAKKDQHDRHESRHKAEEAVHAARSAARHAAKAQGEPAAGATPAAFLARASDAMPLPAEHLAGAALCVGAIALAGAVRVFGSRDVRLNEQPALG